ncbi:MAG TPA: DUF1540 domain-containing protein [Firmicutes bacterium]|nr:DUF1540 domain-containing protein [Bacillota bacterium]
MTDVKCKVSSCQYWGSGNRCEADSILVDHDQMRSDTTRTEVSSLDFDKDSRFFDSQNPRDGRQYGVRSSDSRLDAGTLGGMTSQHKPDTKTSEATCCRTFRPKGSLEL